MFVKSKLLHILKAAALVSKLLVQNTLYGYQWRAEGTRRRPLAHKTRGHPKSEITKIKIL